MLNMSCDLFLPQYLGSRTPEKVKSKILELMYSWTLGLPEEVKITEAYQMLKKQGGIYFSMLRGFHIIVQECGHSFQTWINTLGFYILSYRNNEGVG